MAQFPLSRILVLCAVAVCVAVAAAGATKIRHVEDFVTDVYKNPGHTTASWNTTAGELALFPFELSLVGSYTRAADAYDVEVRGNFAYMAYDHAGLIIVNITVPTTPTLIGSYNTIGNTVKLAVDGKLAYIADGSGGFRIIDVTNSTLPAELGSYTSTNDVTAVAIDGKHAYIADSILGLIVLDVSNAALPVVLGSAPPSAGIVDLAAEGKLVFAANSLSGLEIYDVSDPTTPALLATYSAGGVWSVAAQGPVVYGSTASAFIAVDISTPSTPVLAGSVSTAPNAVVDITLDGFNAYAANGDGGLMILNVVDPSAPRISHQFALTEPANGVAHAGEHAFVANAAGGLSVIDVTELAPPVLGGKLGTGSTIDMAIRGPLSYLAAGAAGVEIIDMSDPLSPVLVGSYMTADVVRGIDVAGQIAYVANHGNGLIVLDVADPANPVQIGNYDTPNIAFDVVVAGNHAFFADSAAVRVFDISDPANPALIGTESAVSAALGVVVAGNYLYVAQGHAGLGVIDITDPSTPTLVGAWNSPGFTENLIVDGDLAFLADLHGGLQIVNISNPTSPFFAGSYASSFLAADVSLTGNFVFVATGATTAKVVDVTDTGTPVFVKNITTTISTQRLRVSGDLLCVGGSSSYEIVKIFENRVVFADNAARSLALDDSDELIVRARLAATQVDSIDWDLSANYGNNWIPAQADGAWQKFTVPGNSLVWRSELFREPNATGLSPVCTLLEIDWRYEFCVVNGINDVPGDEGGWIDVDFTRSGYDFTEELSTPVLGYNIHLRIDDPAFAHRVVAGGRVLTESLPRSVVPAGAGAPPMVDSGPGVDPAVLFVESGPGTKTYEYDNRYFVFSDGLSLAAPPGLWEIVGSVFAQQADTYALAVPSRGDSSAAIPYSVFYVSTHTTVPGVFFNSPVDSGYSVDNLPPAPPLNFAVAYNTGSGNDLTWDPSPEPDFQYYRIYGDTDPGFTPEPANLVHSTSDPYWTDPATQGWRYYKITALDNSLNESDATAPTTITSVTGDVPAPDRFALHQNVPNPFNPSTVVTYDVPPSGGNVRLAIYDVGGRLVRVLIDEFQMAGQKRVAWNGRDDGGAQVASGVYFLRMLAPGFEQTLKMSLIQ